MKSKMILGTALVVAMSAQSALIYNGDLNAAVEKEGDGNSNTAFHVDPVTEKINYTVNGSVIHTTSVNVNEWTHNLSPRGFDYSATGGANGDGAFVQHSGPDTMNGSLRSTIQFAKDNGITKGDVDIKMDVFLRDGSATGTLLLFVDLYAWNSGQTGPIIGSGKKSKDVLGDAVILLDNIEFSSLDMDASTWTTVDVGHVNLGDEGYDFYAWRIGVAGQAGDVFAYDNVVVISKSSTLGLLSLAWVHH